MSASSYKINHMVVDEVVKKCLPINYMKTFILSFGDT